MASRRQKKERLVAEDMLGWLDASPEPAKKKRPKKVRGPRVRPRNPAAFVERSLNPAWKFDGVDAKPLNIKQKRGGGEMVTSIATDDRNYSDGVCRVEKGKDLRACHVELRFIGPKAQESAARKGRNLERGTYLRFCSERKKPGALIPVNSAAQAAKLAREFCECRKTESASVCVTRFGKKYGPRPGRVTLGGLRKPKN